MKGLGFGFRVSGLGFRVHGFGFRVQGGGSGFRVSGLGCRGAHHVEHGDFRRARYTQHLRWISVLSFRIHRRFASGIISAASSLRHELVRRCMV